MATSRVALKSRKLLVAVPATMLLPPRPSIDRLADRQPAHVDPVVAVDADHDVMAIAAIEQVVAVGGTRDGEGIIAGAAEEIVVARAAVDQVVAGRYEDTVIAFQGIDFVVRSEGDTAE